MNNNIVFGHTINDFAYTNIEPNVIGSIVSTIGSENIVNQRQEICNFFSANGLTGFVAGEMSNFADNIDKIFIDLIQPMTIAYLV